MLHGENMSNELISIMFNSQKIKYSELDLYFKRTDIEKTIYFLVEIWYNIYKVYVNWKKE